MAFKGLDWTELAVKWGITVSNRNDDEILCDLDKRISYSVSLNEVLESNVIDDARKFLSSLTKNEMYKQPLFQGLLAIEDDLTFIKYFRVLLPHMWV
ncbi:hypothetical protein AB4Z17_17630 [Paenibacillus sp. TAF43_2]|uniref:hypothetical protein n=1 Tax=Paenibacillus sp. TAF43_2 TaxID=3233069 RepID=UPI003F9E3218